MIDRFSNEFRAAARVLLRNPGANLAAVVTLALGVGANTAIFTVINAVLLRPLPFSEPDRIVTVWETDRVQGGRGVVGPLNFRDLRESATSLDAFAAYGYESYVLAGSGEAERLLGATVTGDFFDVFGVRPIQGRTLAPTSDAPGAPREAVLSDGFWKRRFGGDPAVVGRTLLLSGVAHEIAGVMPPGFAYPHANVDVWTSYPIDYTREERGNHYLFSVARLGPNVPLSRARDDLDAIARRLGETYPETNENVTVLLVPLQDEIVGSARTLLLVVLGAVGLVLLIACANVANLVLVRAAGRATEIAIRRALGAGTTTLARQFLAEACLLSGAAGVAGVLLAFWGVGALVRSNPTLIPRSAEITPDLRVLAAALLVVVVIALVLAAVQTLAFGRDSGLVLRESAGNSAGRGRQWLRGALAGAQIALVLPLLMGAGLLFQTMRALQAVPTGFRPDRVLTMNASLAESRYAAPERQRLFVDGVLDRVRSLPGVESAGITSDLPFSGSRSTSSFDIEGAEVTDRTPVADHRQVSPGYFEAMGIDIVRGRAFDNGDGEGAVPVAVINETLARRYFADTDPIGQRIIYSRSRTRVEVVGIVQDVVHDDLRAEPAAEIYVPFAQFPLTRIFLAVRGPQQPATLLPAIRAAVAEVDAEQPVYSIRTMEERVAQSIAPQRATSLLIGLFSTLALILSAIGLYAVIAFGVAQRTREMAIRTALGARPADLWRLVLGQGLTLVVPGLLAGIVATIGFTRVLASQLFGVGASDPVTLAAVSTMLAGVALAACWSPARRAMHADPVRAIRT